MTRKDNDRTDIGKSPTGIPGLDEITFGGLPTAGRRWSPVGQDRKTLLGVSFLANGAQSLAEPGVLVTFEENAAELAQDLRSLGYDLSRLIAQRKLLVDHVHVGDRRIRPRRAVRAPGQGNCRDWRPAPGAGQHRDPVRWDQRLGLLRAQLRRLFRWLRDRGITTVVSAERGGQFFTCQGLEEFITDAVIALDHRVHHQISTRRIRIVKYRGSIHGTNEYPFLIDRDGITVLPVTSLRLEHAAPDARISSGLSALDDMLGGKGFYRGSTILVSGTPGAGKTTFAAHFVDAACARGEKCLYFLFEESPQQMIRNMRAAGIDVSRWVTKGLLRFHADRPNRHGLETHLLPMHQAVEVFEPDLVVMDPITNLLAVGSAVDVSAMLTRVVDFSRHAASRRCSPAWCRRSRPCSTARRRISSLMDTWILVAVEQQNRHRTRQLCVLKSRGMPHSDSVHTSASPGAASRSTRRGAVPAARSSR